MKTDLKNKRIYEITVVFPPSLIKRQVIEGYRVIIPGFEEYEFFLHKDHILDDGNWRLSEATTGAGFPDSCNSPTRQETINLAAVGLKKIGKTGFARCMTAAKRIIKNPELLEARNASKQ